MKTESVKMCKIGEEGDQKDRPLNGKVGKKGIER